MKGPYITVKEAAARLGMDAASVRHLLLRGTLRGVKFGRDWQVSAASVAAYQPARQRGRPRKGVK